MQSFLPVLVMAIVTLIVLGAMLAIPKLLAPRRPNPEKLSPYECGVWPVGDARRRFAVKYYVVAMLFILFDIEAIFLYPWAVYFRQLRLYGLVEIAVFVGLLFVGYLYIWKSGGFEWD